MGEIFSRLNCCSYGNKEIRVLMLGLDNAGKTTTLYKLKFDQPVVTVPTIGFNVECYMQGNVKLNIWDIGGQDKIRPLWRHYYTGSKALVFVVDSHDRERIEEARQELFRILNDREMRNIPLLVFANKQDLAGAMTKEELTTALALDRIGTGRMWMVQSSCAVEGHGLWDGLTWLMKSVKANSSTKNKPTK